MKENIEESFRKFFPSNDILADAYNVIKPFNRKDYKYTNRKQELVDLSKISGTWYDRYTKNNIRWIDMLYHLDRIKNNDFWPQKIERILHEYDTHNIDLARIEGSDEYFIWGNGHHRVTLWKLSDLGFKTLPVSLAVRIDNN